MTVPSDYLEPHQTDRLVIRPLGEEHISPWVDYMSNPLTMRYFPDFLRLEANTQAPIWIKRQQDRYVNEQFGLLAMHLTDGTFIGQCGLLLQEVDEEFILEIGYHLYPEQWGKGYATEAATYFKEYVRQYLLSTFVVSLIHPDNTPSQEVAKRNGMTPWKETVWKDIPVIVFRTAI